MKSLTTAVLAPVALLAALTACGTTEASEVAGSEAAPAASSKECTDDIETSTGPVSLTDSFGRKVELDKPAERVAVLEWQQTEDVLTLCVAPVAVADAEGYSTWNTAEELPKGVTDVGTRGEPNLDALFGANPDLVIIEAYTPDDAIIKQLEKYDVPVLATKGADAADPIKNMTDTFTLIAEATGREQRATDVVAELETSLDEASEALADVENTEFVYFDGWIQGGNVALRPFGQGSLMGELGEAVGLTNAWTGKVDEAYGLGQTDIEGLAEVKDATFLHTGTVDPAGDFVTEMEKNDIFRSFPAVEEGRTHAFPEGTWTFGGPRSAQQAIEAYVDLLTD